MMKLSESIDGFAAFDTIRRMYPFRGATYDLRGTSSRISSCRLFSLLLFTLPSLTAQGCATAAPATSARASVSGRIFILPGVTNTQGETGGIAKVLKHAFPDHEVSVRRWGRPFLALTNLRSYERNVKKARELADEIAALRRAEPSVPIDIVGLSGGGAMALFVIEALPEDVSVRRVVLLAPAISRGFPIEMRVMPKVDDFVLNFISPLDWQVSLGTKVFGTMDRRAEQSAGYTGFPVDHPRLLQVPWRPEMMMQGHFGNHLSYLSEVWQQQYVAPALDPSMTIEAFRTRVGLGG